MCMQGLVPIHAYGHMIGDLDILCLGVYHVETSMICLCIMPMEPYLSTLIFNNADSARTSGHVDHLDKQTWTPTS